MALALFDLDNTLLAGDSDHLWGEFLTDRNLVDGTDFKQQNDLFYQQYIQGTLDVHAYLRFVLAPLAGKTRAQLATWYNEYLTHYIEPIILPAGQALIAAHRQAGDTLVMITATNDFITAPIAKRFGFAHLLASRAASQDGVYTGEVAGTPCFREGKVVNLNAWLDAHPHDLAEATFYSDSHNDLPLLLRVGTPVAVNPDEALAAHARDNGWKILDLRQGDAPTDQS